MNKSMLAVIGVVIIMLGAVTIMGYDASMDGDDSTTETDGNDETFRWPKVNDDDMGEIIMEHHGSTVTFSAMAKTGFEFIHWVYDDGKVYSDSKMVEFPIGDVEQITAEFGVLDGSIVVEHRWKMPVFGENGIDGTTDQVFTMTLDSSAWDDSIHSEDIVRRANSNVLVPGGLVSNDVAVKAITSYLGPMVSEMTNLQKAIVIMYFVQDAISYETDVFQYGTEEFWATPMETVYSGAGDCEDTAVLYVSIALMMGLDAGLVSFEDPEQGHMSVAVALDDTEEVIGGAVFSIGDITYVYVETAVDGRNVPLGSLSPMYDINQGKWTQIGFDTESDSFIVSETVPISDGISIVSYGTPCYGENVRDPSPIHIDVGDTFVYSVKTFGALRDMTATGNGMESEGGFLTFTLDNLTLMGKATESGIFDVILTGYGFNNVAIQNITIVVDDPSGSFGAAISNPPEIPMNVGDTFSYTPTTSLPSKITASGNGLAGEYDGSFLTWDAETNTLYGTAIAPGSYTVVLESSWSANGLVQTAYQVIEFEVSDGESGTASENKELVYASGEWTIVTDPVDGSDDRDVMEFVIPSIILVLAIIIGATLIRRVAL